MEADLVSAQPCPVLAQGSGRYAGAYPGFTQPGTYRIVFYAEDAGGLGATPVVVEVKGGDALFLPFVER